MQWKTCPIKVIVLTTSGVNCHWPRDVGGSKKGLNWYHTDIIGELVRGRKQKWESLRRYLNFPRVFILKSLQQLKPLPGNVDFQKGNPLVGLEISMPGINDVGLEQLLGTEKNHLNGNHGGISIIHLVFFFPTTKHLHFDYRENLNKQSEPGKREKTAFFPN